MVTEVWAEPQFGALTVLNSELKYLEGLQYNQVPHAVCKGFTVNNSVVNSLMVGYSGSLTVFV